MVRIAALFGLSLLVSGAVYAKGGDSIRDHAPFTALLYDLREGNFGPLQEAYFDKELDFFLDFKGATQGPVGDLYKLREAGRKVGEKDLAGALRMINSVKGYDDRKAYIRAAVLASQKRYKQSLEVFRRLIDKRDDLPRDLASLSFMGAARVFHEIGDYTQAIYHYHQVQQLQPEFFQSIFEKSWSYYQDGDMNGALGVTLTFISPYGKNVYYPEAFIVRAASFYQLCYFNRANGTIEWFKDHYGKIQTQIGDLLRRNPNSWLFEDSILNTVDPKVVALLVQDHSFRATKRAVIGFEKEARKMGGREGSVAKRALATLKKRLANEARRVLAKADKDLKKFMAQADLIQIEILQLGANLLRGQEITPETEIKTMDLYSRDFDEMIQFWPFKGEFWVDELGSHYYGLRSNCSQE